MANTLTPIFVKTIQFYRRMRLRWKGVKVCNSASIGKNIGVNIYKSFFDIRCGTITIGENCKISDGVILDTYGGNIVIGKNVFIGPYSIIYGHGNVHIGDDTLIAMGCKIISANHQIPCEDEKIRLLPDLLGEINIGNDVWLGADVKVLSGIKIGDGCIVGAGSVANKDLLAYTISVGSPAKTIAHRSK